MKVNIIYDITTCNRNIDIDSNYLEGHYYL